MDNLYLLYIDVLGFRKLVRDAPARVEDLFQIVASLNVHKHHSFASIVFSDTILVHNVVPPVSNHDHQYIVMYQCEFFRDLMHRFAGRNIALRAVLTYGPFKHYRLNDVPYFYGPSLINAYEEEKKLKITGLLMDDHCRRFSNIFSTRPYDERWHYVFVTQAIDMFEDVYDALVPLPRSVINDTDLGWVLGPELEILAYSLRESTANSDPGVREKHLATLKQYRRRYPRCFSALEHVEFRMEAVSPDFDWQKVRARMKEDFEWGSIRRPARAGGYHPGEA